MVSKHADHTDGAMREGTHMDTIRFGVIGTSMISENFIETLRGCPDARYVGSMGMTSEESAAATERNGGTVPFASLEELAASDAVDAVYIATPNAIHYGQALPLVEAGKHVMVEKPLSSDAAKARNLIRAARAKGVVAMEAMRPVHDPGIARIKELAERIAPIRCATLRYGKYSSRYDDLLAGRHTNIFDTHMATGALMDLGIYCVETMVYLFGAPKSISCSPVMVTGHDCELTHGAIDGLGSIVARYDDKVVELAYSKISQDLALNQIEGERGTITFENMSAPDAGTLHLRGRAVRNAAKATAQSIGDREEPIAFEPCDNNMVYELEHFVACVKGDRDVAPYQEVSLASLEVMDEARRQAGIVFPGDGEV